MLLCYKLKNQVQVLASRITRLKRVRGPARVPSEEDESFAKLITKTITRIIANDYRKIYGDEARSQTKRRAPARSPVNGEEHGPNPKGVAGLHKLMGRVLMVQV